MHPFHDYLCGQLDELLKKRSIVVFYDPRREFAPLFDRELEQSGAGCDGLPRVLVNERPTFVARYEGSFFGLRADVEPIAERDEPDPLIVYLPGVEHDRRESVLMELEKAGASYKPQLRRLARIVLRGGFTDGQIDEMLRPESVDYDDIVSFLRQGEESKSASILRTIFGDLQGEALLIRWLADEKADTTIRTKEATAELLKLIESRLGLPIESSTTVPEARATVLRYVLISEFRSDLQCEPPQTVALVAEPPSKEHLQRVREVAHGLRRDHLESYIRLANQVEGELGLARVSIDAARLGSIDTFRFEERALLAHVDELVCAREYEGALQIVVGRKRSFWVDRDVSRQAQWEACRLVSQLGLEVERVRPAFRKVGESPANWVQEYAAEDGWFLVDTLQRRLESWVARMDEDPEIERGLAVVRREYEELLKAMAVGFAQAVGEAGWSVPDSLQQTRIYPDVVESMGGAVAYFLVDAMRFEMGIDLARQLDGVEDLTTRPAIAALPTITSVGMAALLPGAAASFSVVERKGKLAACIEGRTMVGLTDRLKFLKAKVADVVDIPLGKLLGMTPTKLGKSIGDASLVVVRSQDIDALGENIDALTARASMEGVIGNVARAIRKLGSAGIENFVVTADHGHQFSLRKDEDMKTDNPGGDRVESHRRCWAGHGGITPPGTVRVSGAELGYDTKLDFVFPVGLGVFSSGGGLSYHHGGLSLQEMVIPVVSLRIPEAVPEPPGGLMVQLKSAPDVITNRTFGVKLIVDTGLISEDTALKVRLMEGPEEVGNLGMAIGGELDCPGGKLRLESGEPASLGLMLTRENCKTVRIVVVDAASDAVLAQTGDIPVKLGI